MKFIKVNPEYITTLQKLKTDLKKEVEFYKNLLSTGELNEVIEIKSSVTEVREALEKYNIVENLFEVVEEIESKEYNPLFNQYLRMIISNNFDHESFYYDSEDFYSAKKEYLNGYINKEDLINSIPEGYGAGGGGGYVYHDILIYLANNILHKIEIFYGGLKNISLLEKISQIDSENIVIIGPNGSGKSTLSRQLNIGEDFNGINIISSQHYLAITNTPFVLDPLGNHLNVRGFLGKDKLIRNNDEEDYEYLNDFNNLVNYLLIEHFSHYSDTNKPNNSELSVLDRVIELWNNIVSKHEIIIKKGVLKVKNSSNEMFDFNNLSDGERQIFYFLSNSLLSLNSPYLIVDEPENHLNPQISKVLWDIIETELKGTQIIYITHDPDFASSRSNSTLIWSKKYLYPDHWDFEIISNDVIPTELMVEVLGSKLNIILCEGTLESEDYKIYSSIYINHKVIPVQGHLNVINYTKALNSFQNIHLKVNGIIDGDLKFTTMKNYEKEKNIHIINVNEIEMLTMVDFVMHEALQIRKNSIGEDFNINNKINEFKEKFFNKINERKEKISVDLVKAKIENILSNEKLHKPKNLQEIKHEISRINNMIEADKFYHCFLRNIDNHLKNKDYKILLEYCNLKEEVRLGLTNQVLFRDYHKYAKAVIRNNKRIQSRLKGEYLPNLN